MNLVVTSIAIVFYLSVFADAQTSFTNCYQVDTLSNYKLYWDLSVPGRISFLIQAQTSGWIGLGLSTGAPYPMISNGNMSDIWVGWVDPNSTSPCAQGCVYDYNVREYQQPSLDPSEFQSLQFITANTSRTGVTSVAFSRALATNDSYDRPINIDGTTIFIWATNPSQAAVPTPDGTSFPMHTPGTKGVFALRLNNASQCRTTPSTSRNSFTNSDGTYTAEWTVNADDNTITFTITAATRGWVGIGFSHTASMPNSDVYVGWIDPSGAPVMSDRYATNYVMPELDTTLGGKSDILSFGDSSDGDPGITKITFTRPLDTGDRYDVALQPGNIYLLWAYGAEGSVNYDAQIFAEHTAKGIAQVDLFSGCITLQQPTVDLLRIHGVVMVVSICVLMFPGILLSRYYKIIIPKWFYIHATLQVLGYAGIISAFVVAFVAKYHIFVVGLHTVFGVIAFTLFGLEILFGFMSHFMWSPDRKGPPIFPDKVHWWLGRSVFLFALITIYLGLLAYGTSFRTQILYIVWLVLALLVLIYLQCAVGQTHEDSSAETVQLASSSPSSSSSIPKSVRDTPSKRPLAALFFIIASSIALLVIGFTFQTRPVDGGPGFSGNARLCINFENFVIPPVEKSYFCKGFTLPSDKDYHITQFEATRNNELMLYNLMLYVTTDFLDGYFVCDPMPPNSSPLYAWSPGGEDAFTLPADVGFRVGKGGLRNLILQVHYYNPERLENITDSSGIRLSMTSLLLPTDAGVITTGIVGNLISIPANLSFYEIAGSCALSTLSPINSRENYTAFGSGVHMHNIGQQIFTDQFRPDPLTGLPTNVGVVGCDDYYTFNDQKTVSVNATFRASDTLTTHCIYNSSRKATDTVGCESSECEMCLTYIWYYPKIGVELTDCLSTALLPVDSNSTHDECELS